MLELEAAAAAATGAGAGLGSPVLPFCPFFLFGFPY